MTSIKVSARRAVLSIAAIAVTGTIACSESTPTEMQRESQSGPHPAYNLTPVNLNMMPWEYGYVEETGSVEELSDDAALSRCPDEPRNPLRTIFLRGRTLGISAVDENGKLIHFTLDSELLRFSGYISRGAVYSKARYTLAMEALSNDLKYVAPFGATTVMSCKLGRYLGSKALRTYKGELRLEDISPVYASGIGEPPDEPSDDCDPDQDEYDPYAIINPCGGGGGSSGGGGGTQYEPGDNTGGETVNWSTGQGNGGTSACGSAAEVAFVCIDTWNGSEWVEWGCGYVTTC